MIWNPYSVLVYTSESSDEGEIHSIVRPRSSCADEGSSGVSDALLFVQLADEGALSSSLSVGVVSADEICSSTCPLIGMAGLSSTGISRTSSDQLSETTSQLAGVSVGGVISD